MKKEISGFESFVYYLFNICTFGALWIYKITMKKALSEMVK